MKDRLPALIALFMLLALVGITWWAADYAERTFSVEPELEDSHDPDAWSGAFTMLQSDENGVPVTRLDGAKLRHYPHNGSYEIDQPELISQRPDSPRVIASSDIAYSSKCILWSSILSHFTGRKVPIPTCKVTKARRTPFALAFSRSSSVKWSPAVGAATDPSSLQ